MTQVRLIEASQLEADAVLPQCLDNNFVSNETYNFIEVNDLDYSDGEVQRMREHERRNEFMRSLVYASQVVVNRAFLSNDDFLIKHFLPSNREDLVAAATLVRGQAIVPYLFKEKTLLDEAHYDRHIQWKVALQTLIEEVDKEITCVRLAVDDETNEANTAIVSRAFRSKIADFKHFDARELSNLASEVIVPNRSLDETEWVAFKRQIDELASFAANAGEFNRHRVYGKFFTVGSETGRGQFKKRDRDSPFLFELKKIVDLVYNSNLPDALDRFTFSPLGLPSRAALADKIQNRKPINLDKILPSEDVLQYFRRQFKAHTDQAMVLPFLADLKMSEIVTIRKMEEWQAFQAAQAAILRDPLRFAELLPDFSAGFDTFQRALSKWFVKRQRAQTEAKYANFVTFLLQLAGRTICAYCVHASGGEPMTHVTADTLMDEAIKQIPARAKGVTVKLLMGVYNTEEKRIDRHRSYTVELMRSQQEVLHEEIRGIYERLVKRSDIPVSADLMADQGK
jgi:hypothetical protein